MIISCYIAGIVVSDDKGDTCFNEGFRFDERTCYPDMCISWCHDHYDNSEGVTEIVGQCVDLRICNCHVCYKNN